MTYVDAILDRSRRFQTFREELIRIIPRLPNDKVSLKALQSKRHADLLIIYMCWRLRNIAIRPRTVIGRSMLDNNPRADTLRPNINAFIKMVEAGSDLEPYLSLKAHRQGYVMSADPEKTSNATWEDKDFLLNVMGLHHFHLGLHREAKGLRLMARTKYILFASVSRDTFEILGLFDHSVFDDWTTDEAMTPERGRLWSIYEERQAANNLPGQFTIGGFGNLGITTAGTPLVITLAADRQIRKAQEIEPKLDDPVCVRTPLENITYRQN